jgi:NAD(P)-dependent dehydrogenase (short-subunit alcohol dehydrogenase family)
MAPTVYLITGANRGLGMSFRTHINMKHQSRVVADSMYDRTGFGFVQAILERPDVVVFAGARDPSRADKLKALAAEHPNKIHVVKITSADETDNKAAVEEIKRIVGRLDIVISNAGKQPPTIQTGGIHLFGISHTFFLAFSDMSGPVIATPTKMMTDAFAVNALGTLVLFQATYPLLKASTSTPKFIPISSALGSITMGTQYPAPFLAYGASKAALNYTARKIRADTEGLGKSPLVES